MLVLATIGYVLVAARFYLWAATKCSYLQEFNESAEIVHLFPEDAVVKQAA